MEEKKLTKEKKNSSCRRTQAAYWVCSLSQPLGHGCTYSVSQAKEQAVQAFTQRRSGVLAGVNTEVGRKSDRDGDCGSC